MFNWNEIDLPGDEEYAAWKLDQDRKKAENRALISTLTPASEVIPEIAELEAHLARLFALTSKSPT